MPRQHNTGHPDCFYGCQGGNNANGHDDRSFPPREKQRCWWGGGEAGEGRCRRPFAARSGESSAGTELLPPLLLVALRLSSSHPAASKLCLFPPPLAPSLAVFLHSQITLSLFSLSLLNMLICSVVHKTYHDMGSRNASVMAERETGCTRSTHKPTNTGKGTQAHAGGRACTHTHTVSKCHFSERGEISSRGELSMEEKRKAQPHMHQGLHDCSVNSLPDLHRWILGKGWGGLQIAHLKELNVAWQQKTLSEVRK